MVQLRPRSVNELHGLLALCQAAVLTLVHPARSSMIAPSGLAHFVKSRHGPYFALMSVLCKLKGRDSPAYWDLFRE